MIQEHYFTIRILSPVHIGCGEVYEPAGFIVDEKERLMYSFNPIDFVKSLNRQDRDRLAAICAKGTIESIIELYLFMRNRTYPGHLVHLCQGFLQHYSKTLSIPTGDRRKIGNELNKFTISRTAFNPRTQKPYIPGSSIKGALRTACLNSRQAQKNLTPARNARQLEQELLDGGSFESDPLRLLKVSDFHPVENCRTKVVYAVNEKKKPSKFTARGPFQMVEAIEPGALFGGTIRVLPPLSRDIIRTPFASVESLLENVTFFYGRERAREVSELEAAGLPVTNMYELNGGYPLRLGRHSGAESLTIEGHRNIRIMKKKGEPPDHRSGATTFWLAADRSAGYNKAMLASFGWTALMQANDASIAKLRELHEREPEREDNVEIKDMQAEARLNDVDERPVIEETSPAEKLLEELKLIKPTDMGRIGTIIQGIEGLESVNDKAAVAVAIRDKIGPKAYRKHKRRDYLESLIFQKDS
jgi:CRISPR-associated protein Csm5